VELPCGSHTLTGAKDGDRLIVYSNNSSSAGCVDGTRVNDDPVGDFIDVIEVPLGDAAGSNLLRREPLAGPLTDVRTGCHDAGLILGDVNLLACASADAINVFDVGANALPGGSLADPAFLYVISEPGVGQAGTNGRWHSAVFTWDGEVIVGGWEPGGGASPECETADPRWARARSSATPPPAPGWASGHCRPDRTASARTARSTTTTSCRFAAGSASSSGATTRPGTWVTESTDPANPVTLGWSYPPAISPPDLGGAWSSYWYNNFIHESRITEGLNVFRLSGNETGGAIRLEHLNP